MGLYNAIFGANPHGKAILATLGLTTADVGRYRDCFVTADGEIAIYTRNGGGNREHWDDEKESGEECGCTGCTITYTIPKHALYLRDVDDDFDSTYATVYYTLPEEFADDLRKIALAEPFNPSERWRTFIDALAKEAPDKKA